MKGFDICWHENGEENNEVYSWKQVRESGIDFIILRDGWGTDRIDQKLLEYCQGAQDQNIAIAGVYHFIYALNLQQAVQNAIRAVMNVEKAGLPKSTVIWCDLEYDTVTSAKKQGVTLTAEMQREFAEAFCNYCLSQGYCTGIYCNADYLVNVYGTDIIDSYDIWLADLEGDSDYSCVYRQYDWNGTVKGVSGGLDMDVFVGNYTAGTTKPKNAKTDILSTKAEKNLQKEELNHMIKSLELLNQIHDVVDHIPTIYQQGDAWGAWNGSAFRLDCIIFIKCMVYWNWYYPDKTKSHGGAKYDANYDWTEIGILNRCTNVSDKNFLSAKPCEYLYMDGHGGFKIDEFVKDGKTYNVAECTVASAWGSPKKCIYSYVDDNGNRYNYMGGIQNGSWTHHGQLYGVDYSDQDEPQPEPEPTPEPEPKETKISMEKFVSFLPWVQKGSTGETVKLLQNCLAVLGYYTDAVDGSAGPNTVAAMQAYQNNVGLYPDGVFGTKSWTKLLED